MPRILISIIAGVLTAFMMHASAMVGELVTVTTQFYAIKTPATLWLQIRHVQGGHSLPVKLDLHGKQHNAVIQTQAIDYRIERAWLQFDTGETQRLSCLSPTRALLKQGLTLTLSGRLAPGEVQCHAQVYTAEPITQTQQALLHAQQQLRQLGAGKSQPAAKIQSAQAKYFAALRECVPGVYNVQMPDPFLNKSSATLVSIRGLNQGYCLVSKQIFDVTPQGRSIVDAVCQYSESTRNSFTDELAAEFEKNGHDAFTQGEGAQLKQRLCQSCVAKRGNDVLTCDKSE